MFTENLKYLRKKYELQQNELAARLGYTDATISQWEHGASVPRHKALIKLSEIFNVSIDDLLYSDLTTNKAQKTGNSVRIKVFGSVPAGIPTEAIEDIVDWEEIPKDRIRHILTPLNATASDSVLSLIYAVATI